MTSASSGVAGMHVVGVLVLCFFVAFFPGDGRALADERFLEYHD